MAQPSASPTPSPSPLPLFFFTTQLSQPARFLSPGPFRLPLSFVADRRALPVGSATHLPREPDSSSRSPTLPLRALARKPRTPDPRTYINAALLLTHRSRSRYLCAHKP